MKLKFSKNSTKVERSRGSWRCFGKVLINNKTKGELWLQLMQRMSSKFQRVDLCRENFPVALKTEGNFRFTLDKRKTQRNSKRVFFVALRVCRRVDLCLVKCVRELRDLMQFVTRGKNVERWRNSRSNVLFWMKIVQHWNEKCLWRIIKK